MGASSSIVEIQPKGSKPPLFLVHGAGGGMLWGYTNLSRHLGADQPVFAFNSRGLNGQDEFTSIEEMAAQYVADLRAFQPREPYFLGGYCFGGDIAYEMARQLEAQGEKVALLALMNCAPPNSSYARTRWTPLFALRFLRNLCQIAADALQGTRKQKLVFFRWATRSLQKKINRFFRWRRAGGPESDIEKLIVDAEEALELPPDARPLWNTHLHALIAYHPKPYQGKVALFRSRSHPPLCSFDPQCGWGELAAGGVRVTVVPGSHENILDEPHVQAVAEAIKKKLHEIQDASSGNNRE
jgi:thioesterase domain-containing protein